MHQRSYTIKVDGPVTSEGSLMLVCTESSCIADIELPGYADCFTGGPIEKDGSAFSRDLRDPMGKPVKVEGKILPERLELDISSQQGHFQVHGVRTDA